MPWALVGRACDVLHFMQLSQLSPITFDDEEGHEDAAIPPGARCDQVPWQRVVHLGESGPSTVGNPHDAMYTMHRFVHWMTHEDGVDLATPAAE